MPELINAEDVKPESTPAPKPRGLTARQAERRIRDAADKDWRAAAYLAGKAAQDAELRRLKGLTTDVDEP